MSFSNHHENIDWCILSYKLDRSGTILVMSYLSWSVAKPIPQGHGLAARVISWQLTDDDVQCRGLLARMQPHPTGIVHYLQCKQHSQLDKMCKSAGTDNK